MELIPSDEHWVHLSQLLGECVRGRGHVVLLEGPLASGKSTLMHALAEHAARSDVLALEVTCSPSERLLPFGALTQLLHSGALPTDLSERAEALIEQGTSGTVLGAADPDVIDPRVAHVFHGIYHVMRELAAQTPLLVAVDDVRHADVPSQRCLLHLARRLRSSRVLLVVSDETDVASVSFPFRAELGRQPHFQRLTLAPLSRDDVRRLLRNQLGDATAGHLAGPAFAATGGNLGLLKAFAHDHQVAGSLRPQGYGLVLLDQLHRGDKLMLRIARALAVLGDDYRMTEPREVGELAGVGVDSAVDRALRRMTAAGLLDERGFRNAVAAQAVLDDIPPAERVELHRRVALLLHRRDQPAVRVAHHLAEAQQAPGRWAVDVLDDAADQQLLNGHVPTAVRCLELALETAYLTEPEQAQLRAKLVRAEWQLNPFTAARHLTALVGAARAGQLRYRDCVALVRQLLWHGRTDDAAGLLDRLRSGAGDRTAENSAVVAELDLWLACCHPSLARRPVAMTENRGVPRADPWLRPTATLAELFVRGRMRDASTWAEHVLSELRLPYTTAWADEAARLALLVLMCVDHKRVTVEWCERLPAATDTAGVPIWQATFAAIRAEVALRHGDLPTATKEARTALDELSPKAWGVAVGLPMSSLVMAATRMGDYDTAARMVAGPVPDTLFQSCYGLPYLHARGNYHLAVGNPRAALADFLSCGEIMQAWGLDMAGLVPWRTSSAEAWLRLGNNDEARRLVHDQLTRSGVDSSRSRGLALRLLATCSPTLQRPEILTEALELFEECGDRYEQARVLADLGPAYEVVGKRQRARMVLRRARYIADQCGAVPLSQALLAVPRELRDPAVGPGEAETVTALTGAERRVASLAAAGYTNREIANKLYVTPSTVEQHLTQVYRKLKVKRRHELPPDLATGA